MADIRLLNGGHARRLELLTGIADDLDRSVASVDRVLGSGPKEDLELAWTDALVRYGRCFGKGVPAWGASRILGGLTEILLVRHRHFRRLRDTLVSHPGGIGRTYRSEALLDAGNVPHVRCEPIPMFVLGQLEAMDFAELLSTVRELVGRLRSEVENELRFDLAEMSDEQFRQLPLPARLDGNQA